MKNKFLNALSLLMLIGLMWGVTSAGAQLQSEIYANGAVVWVHGVRGSSGAWGTGPVNYQAGVTSKERLPGSGSLEFIINATGGIGQPIGTGTGYKALVQFWNDDNNYIALGFIHDPGVSPNGKTVMVEGASNGEPVGGYWPDNSFPDGSGYHSITVTWTPTHLTWMVDNDQDNSMTYAISMTNPSVSFLGAARMPGDSLNVDFQGITWTWPLDQLYEVEYWTLTWDSE